MLQISESRKVACVVVSLLATISKISIVENWFDLIQSNVKILGENADVYFHLETMGGKK